MKCLDDCHTYELDFFLGTGDGYFESIGSKSYAYPRVHFYEMRLDGTKIDGVTNEEVLRVLIHRLKYLNKEWQNGKFYCAENEMAIDHLEQALELLQVRTRNRVGRGVEGTHQP
jgi:hypothetical protein